MVDAWDEERNVGYDTTQHDAQEDWDEVRVVQTLHLVTQHLLGMSDGEFLCPLRLRGRPTGVSGLGSR